MPARDLNRMREILLKVASDDLKEFGDGWVLTGNEPFFSGTDAYQIDLLVQAGFLETCGRETSDSKVQDRVRVTNLGHDYIDAIRDEGIWAKTKEVVKESGGSATIEIVKALAIGLLKNKISKHTDIDI